VGLAGARRSPETRIILEVRPQPAPASIGRRRGPQAPSIAGPAPGPACGPTSTHSAIHLNRPRSLVLDRACNLYIADSLGDRVVKVDPAGGVTANPGDAARGRDPGHVAIRSVRNVEVARPVGGKPAGKADRGLVSAPRGRRPAAAAAVALAGIGERVSSGDGGPAGLARIGDPLAIAVDGAGSLYVSDGYSTTVRKIAAGRISRFAGGGTGNSPGPQPALAADIYPNGLALDARGDLFIADDLHHQVRMVSRAGVMETVAGTGVPGRNGDHGPALAATLRFPQGVALDADGDLYIADTGNDHIRRVARDGTITTVL
jgi:NHL repeat